MKLADTPPRIGDWVLAVGNPFGLGGTVTAGIVSARGRDIGAGPYDDFLQIDAPVNKGNSGGPTFNTEGSVIGVNTAIFSPSGGSVGIAFAIPAETVKSVVAQLKDKGAVTRGWIGVQIQPVTPEIAESLGLKTTKGALVAEPQKDGPAMKAGIQAGDVITSVDGKPVADARELARTIGAMPPNATVKLAVIRGGAEKTVSLTLGELPKSVRRARELRPLRPAAEEPARGGRGARADRRTQPAAPTAGQRRAAARPFARARRQRRAGRGHRRNRSVGTGRRLRLQAGRRDPRSGGQVGRDAGGICARRWARPAPRASKACCCA